MRYEYHIIELDPDWKGSAIADNMNRMGSYGWRLSNTYTYTDGLTSKVLVRFIFERPLERDSTKDGNRV